MSTTNVYWLHGKQSTQDQDLDVVSGSNLFLYEEMATTWILVDLSTYSARQVVITIMFS
jgi:hypothetical protein